MTYQDPRYRDPEYGTKWRHAHPEVTRERSQRYLESHREENRERASRYYYEHHDDRLEKQRVYNAENRVRIRERMLTRKFGLDAAAYAELLARQEGRCAICGNDGRLGIDHNHATGKVRGLLCSTCNFMVGHGKDDPALLRQAAAYLEAD